MNLSQLYYFKRLAELQHYTKAAQELSITQPSLSGAIHSLEDELGVDLFHKKGRNIVLTKNGSEFYVYVSSALRELDKGIDIMQERASKLKGKIEVGCINALLSDFLPRVVNEFRSQAGTYVQVRAHMEQTNRILESVQSGYWDLGFCSRDEGYSEIEFVPILKQPLVVAALESDPICSNPVLTLDQLIGQTVLIHSVDSFRLAETISEEAVRAGIVMPILIEVNAAAEESKFGVAPSDAEALIREISVLPGVRVEGLMTIAPYTEDPETNRPYFAALRQLSVDIGQKCIDNVSMGKLSMGMTGDFEVAVEEGATHIRVGTGIFGERVYT